MSKNDLISREALKKYKFTTQIANGVEIEDIEVVPVAAIDNAPSVETSKIEYKAYNEGFKDGVEQGIRLSDRPQGKWSRYKRSRYKRRCGMSNDKLNDAIKTIKELCEVQ